MVCGLVGSALLAVQGCSSSSSTGPQPVLVISNLTVRPLGAVLADQPMRFEFRVTVSDSRAVVGGEARLRRALADEVACRAAGKSPIIATAPIGDANISGTAVVVVITLRLPAGRNRLCFSLVTGAGAAEAKKSGQTELTLREVASNELEFTIDVGGAPASGPAAGPDGHGAPAAAPPRPRVRIAATDPSAGEPADPATIAVTRTGSTAGPLTVFFSVAGTATPGADYTALPASVTIPAGVASATVAVTVIDDGELESPETVIVTLAPNAAYVVGSPSSATVTLTSNDGTVTVVANDATAAEPSNPGQFRFTRTGTPLAALPALTVLYTVSGTATPGADYTALSGSVTIPAGAASEVVTVTVIDDGELESPETVIVTLAPNAAYVVGSPSTATVTLTSNE